MIVSFGSAGTEDIWHGYDTKAARKTLPKDLWRKALVKLTMVRAAARLDDLKIPPGNQLHSLTKEKKLIGFHTIRINDQYRVIFRFEAGNAHEVEIIDYH